MQAVLVHPDGARGGPSRAGGRAVRRPGDASAFIRERGGLDAAERLQIYAGMYPLRMVEALRSRLPGPGRAPRRAGLREARARLRRGPPFASFTLARLGDRLPEFLAGWGSPRRRGLLARRRPAGAGRGPVFDAEETAPIDAEPFRPFRPAEWPHVRLRPGGRVPRSSGSVPVRSTSSTPSSRGLRFRRRPAAVASRSPTTGGISSSFAGRWALRREPPRFPRSAGETARCGPGARGETFPGGSPLRRRSFRAGSRSGPASGSSPGSSGRVTPAV